jgi:hypothetical protein
VKGLLLAVLYNSDFILSCKGHHSVCGNSGFHQVTSEKFLPFRVENNLTMVPNIVGEWDLNSRKMPLN